jgi:hypothetical protein
MPIYLATNRVPDGFRPGRKPEKGVRTLARLHKIA